MNQRQYVKECVWLYPNSILYTELSSRAGLAYGMEFADPYRKEA